MTLAFFLGLCVAGSVAALVVSTAAASRRASRLRALGKEWGMHFTPVDRLRLAERLMDRFPVPGAGGLVVTDVLYRTDGHAHHYLATAEFVTGTVGSRRRLRVAVAIVERRSTGRREPDASASKSIDPAPLLGPPGLPLLEQYRHLHEAAMGSATDLVGLTGS